LARWIDAGDQDDTGFLSVHYSTDAYNNKEPASITEKVIYSDSGTPETVVAHAPFDLDSLRNGNWVKGLRDIAINGCHPQSRFIPSVMSLPNGYIGLNFISSPMVKK